jgi:hypothetical protein
MVSVICLLAFSNFATLSHANPLIPLLLTTTFHLQSNWLNAANNKVKAVVPFVSGVSAGAGHISDLIEQCDVDGEAPATQAQKWSCAMSVIMASCSAIICGVKLGTSFGWWKRDTTGADLILAPFQDDVKITDVKVMGENIGWVGSNTILARRTQNHAPINVFYNGTLPLTFIWHHDLSTVSNSTGTIPLRIATDGTNFAIQHIKKINNTDLQRRTGLPDTTNHLGVGGVKIEAQPNNAVSTYQDVVNWLGGDSIGTPAYYLYYHTRISNWVGFAFDDWVIDVTGGRTDGQWLMRVETAGFGLNFEGNWNWCFGVNPNNCP